MGGAWVGGSYVYATKTPGLEHATRNGEGKDRGGGGKVGIS